MTVWTISPSLPPTISTRHTSLASPVPFSPYPVTCCNGNIYVVIIRSGSFPLIHFRHPDLNVKDPESKIIYTSIYIYFVLIENILFMNDLNGYDLLKYKGRFFLYFLNT